MRFILMLSVLFVCFSCNDITKEYYGNGNLKKQYIKKTNDKYEGEYIEFFENGGLKEKHLYKDGIKIDSSFYHDYESDLSETKVWLDNSKHKSIIKDKEGSILREGVLSNSDSLNRIGIWKFYKANNDVWDSIVEYKYVYGKSYANQIWLVKDEDTLGTRGNYFMSFIKEREGREKTIRFDFELIAPLFSYDSEVFVVIPYDDNELKDDFSNLLEIERDTFPSLKNDGIAHPELAGIKNMNNIVMFALEYEESGKERIRGMLVEKFNQNGNNKERRLFFEKYFYVKD